MAGPLPWDEFLRLRGDQEAVRDAILESEEQALHKMENRVGSAGADSGAAPPPDPPKRRPVWRWRGLALGGSSLLVVSLVLLIQPTFADRQPPTPTAPRVDTTIEREAILQAARVYAAGDDPEVACRVITPAHSARITGEAGFGGCVRQWGDWISDPLRGVRVTNLRSDRARIAGVYSSGKQARYDLRRIRGRWLVDRQEGLVR